ncbi:MAG: hypothetical protein ACP6IS_01950 [Candidatus Asgardarchaeia archaeon]
MKRSKVIILIISVALIISLQSLSLVNAQETFDSSVFNPNGATYSITATVNVFARNTSSGEILASNNMTLEAYLKILSERVNLNFWKWSGILNVTLDTYSLEESDIRHEHNNLSIPIPPLIAIKENTRKIYFANVSLEELSQSENMQEAIQKLVQKISVGEINENIYIYNIFYIPTNVNIGSKIDYGFWNVTANEGLILTGTVKRADNVTVAGESIDSWVVELDYHNISSLSEEIYKQTNLNLTDMLFGDMGGSEEDREIQRVVSNLPFTIAGYYDKASGWLVRGLVEARDEGTIEGHDNATDSSVYTK